MKNLKVPGLAKLSNIPYGTSRRILELNTVADYEQMSKIAEALHIPLSKNAEDAENLASDSEIVAEFNIECNNTSDNDAEFVSTIIANSDLYDLSANRDKNKVFEAKTPRD